MTIFLARRGVALTNGVGGKRLLWTALRTSNGSIGSSTVTSISGIGAYWDASTTSGMLGSSGAVVPGWNTPVSAIADGSGHAQTLAAYSNASGATLPQSTARLNGLLGGCGLSTVSATAAPTALASGQYLPLMGPDQGWRASGLSLTASADWTAYLVWSRPNRRQGGSTAPITLIAAGNVPIVTLTSTPGGPNTLAVFGTTVSSAMERRHTYALVLAYTHSTNTLTASLRGNGTTTTVTATASLGAAGPLTFLHDTTANGGAQCWFHEGAYWPRALTGSDLAALITATGRWTLGARKGITIAGEGQSNAFNAYGAGFFHLMAQGVAWYCGALAYNTVASPYNTLIGGVGMYPAPINNFPGTFLTNPGDSGTTPMTDPWALDTASGAIGGLSQAAYAGLLAEDRADIAAIWWPWNETDSCRNYSEKTTVNSAQQRCIQLLRGWIGKSAAQLPWVTWGGMPFPYGTNDQGMCAIRESFYDLTQVSGGNNWIGLTNACDVNPMGSTANANGTITGGDYSHINTPDLPKLAIRGAAMTAKAIMASGGGDTVTSVPAGAVQVGGPRITHVQQLTGTTYKLTITHDAGNDIIIPQQAANGVGFTLMDGGSTAAPGAIINATSCTYIDSAHVLVTLASAPAHAASSCLFFYPYGSVGGVGAVSGSQQGGTGIGSGNAVTDNASTVMPPTGWDIGSQLTGVTWNVNYPLAQTQYGLSVSTSPG